MAEGSLSINWGTPGVYDSYVRIYKNTIGDDYFSLEQYTGNYRRLAFNAESILPSGATLTEIMLTGNYVMPSGTGYLRICKEGEEAYGGRHIHSYSPTKSKRSFSEKDPASLYLSDSPDHDYCISFYNFESLNYSSRYVEVTDIEITLLYEISDVSKIYIGENPVTSACIGGRQINGIYLRGEKLL